MSLRLFLPVLLLVMSLSFALSWQSNIVAQNASTSDGDVAFEVTPLHDGPGSTIMSWNGTSPESPNGERIAYFRMPNAETNEKHTYTGEMWVCDRDLTNRRNVFEVEMVSRGFAHNSTLYSWVDNKRLALRSTAGEHNTIHIINVDTGEVLYEFAADRGGIAHHVINQKLAFSVGTAEQVKANRSRHPKIDEPALYAVDVPSGKIQKILTVEKLKSFFETHGFGPKQPSQGGPFAHVIPNADFTRIQTRHAPKGAGKGVLVSYDTNGDNLVLFPDRPLHQLWYDNETFVAVDRSGQRIDENRIVHFERDGTVIDVLAGPGNHFDVSPDRQWLVSDNGYHQTPVEIRLYRRGEIEPTAILAHHPYGEPIWNKGAHANPVFSRDGTSVYFNHAVRKNRVQAVRVDISPVVDSTSNE